MAGTSAATERPAEGHMLPEGAWGGEEEAFRRLVEGHRAALHSHCYRMLGSLHDAEDAFQETMLRAWRGRAGFEGRSSLASWLHRIATNVCIDAIARRPKRVLPIDYGSQAGPRLEVRLERAEPVESYLDEELGIENGATAPAARYERREAVELAVIAALRYLSARQRAVLILRDVLGFSAKEAAVILKTSVASINSALQRARRVFDERRPEQSRQLTLRSVGDVRMRDLVKRFVNALERGDVGTILALLDEVCEVPRRPGRIGNTCRTMSEVHEQVLIDAPVSSVWELVGDPRRYPEWLPRVFEVQGERFEEGTEFIQISRQRLAGRDEAHFLIDEMDELREIRMHCTISGMFAHWQLTEAQGGTFVNAVFGMDPIRRRDRVIDSTIGRRFFRRWLAEAVESLKRTASGATAGARPD